jgi:hypothetical protein
MQLLFKYLLMAGVKESMLQKYFDFSPCSLERTTMKAVFHQSLLSKGSF